MAGVTKSDLNELTKIIAQELPLPPLRNLLSSPGCETEEEYTCLAEFIINYYSWSETIKTMDEIMDTHRRIFNR